MKIGDLVKLKEFPSWGVCVITKVHVLGTEVAYSVQRKHDWMFEYLEETFQVVDFPTENGVELKMVGTVPDWIWIIDKDNLESINEEG